jgi:hypothetical protein
MSGDQQEHVEDLDVHSARTIGVLAECGAGVAGLLAGGSGRVC